VAHRRHHEGELDVVAADAAVETDPERLRTAGDRDRPRLSRVANPYKRFVDV